MYEKIGIAHGLKGEHQLAIENLEKALEFNKNNPIVVANLGNNYMSTGQVDKAIQLMQACLEEHSHFAPLHATLCVAFSKKAEWERASHHGEMALGIDTTFQSEMVCQILSVAFRELGDSKKSKEYEEKAEQFSGRLEAN